MNISINPSLAAQEKKEELSTTSDDGSTVHNVPDPISTKSRRIQKREKAKQVAQQKQKEKQKEQNAQQLAEKEDTQKQFKLTEEAILNGEIPAKFIPEGFHANLDEKAKKKMLQMIRNRISAQNSRDRKKNLIEHLENQSRALSEENLELKTKVRRLEEENANLRHENQEIKKALNNMCSLGKDQNFSSDIFAEPFNQSSNPSTDSPTTSGNSSPVFRKMMRSGGFMKYSLALATIFAVVMYGGMNTTVPAAPVNAVVNNAPEQSTFQAPLPKGKQFFFP